MKLSKIAMLSIGLVIASAVVFAGCSPSNNPSNGSGNGVENNLIGTWQSDQGGMVSDIEFTEEKVVFTNTLIGDESNSQTVLTADYEITKQDGSEYTVEVSNSKAEINDDSMDEESKQMSIVFIELNYNLSDPSRYILSEDGSSFTKIDVIEEEEMSMEYTKI